MQYVGYTYTGRLFVVYLKLNWTEHPVLWQSSPQTLVPWGPPHVFPPSELVPGCPYWLMPTFSWSHSVWICFFCLKVQLVSSIQCHRLSSQSSWMEDPPPPRTPSDTEASFGRFCILSTHLPGLWVFKDSGLVFFLQPCLLHRKRSQSGRESLQTCGFASWSPVLVRATVFTSGTYSRQICNEEVVSLAARKSLLPDGKSQMVENFADFKTTLLMTFKFRLGGI